MKRIIWLLLLIGAGYLAWKYYPEIERRAQERQAARPSAPAPSPDLPSTPAPAPDNQPAETPPESFDPQVEKRHPLPQFKPLADVVDQWRNIPASAFPRQITLKAPVMMSVAGGAGTARLDPGSKVVALSGRNGILTVAPTIESASRANVPIEHTDFKEVLSGIYEAFQARRIDEVLTARRAAQAELTASQSVTARTPAAPAPPTGSLASLLPERLGADAQPPPPAAAARIGPRPQQNADGTVPLMVASIKERQQAAAKARRQSEPRLEDIKSWGPLHYQEIDGEPYWVGSVRYTAHTIFGEFPAEALALIKNAKVDRWIYAGTKEPVF